MSESLGSFGRCVYCRRRIGAWSALRALGFLGGNALVSGACWRCRLRERGYLVAAVPNGYCVEVNGELPDARVFQDEEVAWREAESRWRADNR